MNDSLCFGCESWLNREISSSELFPSNYVVYRRDRDDGYGGVFLACHHTLSTNEVTLIDPNCELVVCHIQLKNQSSLIVCSVYRPPSSDKQYLGNLCQQLLHIRSKYPNAALWIDLSPRH